MKIICNNKVIDLDKFDTVTCRESLVGEGFPIEAVRKEASGFFGGSDKKFVGSKATINGGD